MEFILLPLIAWCAAGFIKVVLYYIRLHRFKPMEFFRYGGFPSAHTSLVASAVFFAGLREGFYTPVFSIGLALLLVVITDAHGLRRYVGRQAEAVNQLREKNGDTSAKLLKEQVGHSWWEISGGLFIGVFTALFVYWLTR